MKKTLLFATTLLCLVFTCQSKPAETGATPGQWTMDLEAAQKVAKEKKLPIFINFTGSDWCVWCKHMEKEVFTKPEWINYAKDSLVMVWIDFPQNKELVPLKYRDRNQKLAQFFGINAYPAYIVLDEDGQTQLGELEAEQQITPASFITKLNAVLVERESMMQSLIKSMPAKEADALRKAYEERKAARGELQQVQTKQAQLTAQLTALEGTITTLRTKALVDKMPPAQALKYHNTQKELADAKSELGKWVATKPPQTAENKKLYGNMTTKITALEKKITALLYAE